MLQSGVAGSDRVGLPSAWAMSRTTWAPRTVICRRVTVVRICGERLGVTKRRCGFGPSRTSVAWATTQFNLGFALREQGQLTESVHAFILAERGYERIGDLIQADEAKGQGELSGRMQNPETDDRNQ